MPRHADPILRELFPERLLFCSASLVRLLGGDMLPAVVLNHLDWTGADTHDRWVPASAGRLAERFGVSGQQVRRAKQKLVRLGFIDIQDRPGRECKWRVRYAAVREHAAGRPLDLGDKRRGPATRTVTLAPSPATTRTNSHAAAPAAAKTITPKERTNERTTGRGPTGPRAGQSLLPPERGGLGGLAAKLGIVP